MCEPLNNPQIWLAKIAACFSAPDLHSMNHLWKEVEDVAKIQATKMHS